MSPEPLTHWEGRSVEAWRREWSLPHLEVYPTIDSTNDRARELGEQGADTGTTILAEEQRAGRGRRGRRWLAPRKTGLLLSMIFRYRADRRSNPGAAPLRIALAVSDAVRDATGILPDVKWPNDLLIRGRKVAGILCEGASAGEDAFLVAGIGLNVAQQTDDWPADLRDTATSLRAELDAPVRHVYLAGWLIHRLRRIAPAIASDLNPDELDALRQRNALHGRPIRIDQDTEATALGIQPDGSLRIRDAHGAEGTVRAGSVTLAS